MKTQQRILIITLWLLSTGLCAQPFTNGTQLFDESYVHQINFISSNTDLWDTLSMRYFLGSSAYTECSVSIDGNLLSGIGLKEKGNFSNWGTSGRKKPLKIDFSEYLSNQKYDGLKKVNLSNGFQDPSMMHDALCYKILRDAGLPAPRTSYAKVSLNGVYWGLYVLVEEPDKKFLNDRLPDKNGNLYKCNSSNLEWEGNLQTSYTDNFEQSLSFNGDTSFTDLITLHDKINNTTSHFRDTLDAYFNIDTFLKCMAVDYLTANWDNMIGHGRNFSLYHSTTDGRFHWIPWDYNLAFSDYFIDLLRTSTLGGTPSPLWTKCMNDPTLKADYLSYVCDINTNYFINTYLDNYIDNIKNLIRPDLNIDPNYTYTINNFDQVIEEDAVATEFYPDGTSYTTTYKGIKSLIAERHDLANNELIINTYTCALTSTQPEKEMSYNLNLYPNPASSYFMIDNNFTLYATIEVYSILGQLVHSQILNDKSTRIETGNWIKGIYFTRFTFADKSSIMKKVIVE